MPTTRILLFVFGFSFFILAVQRTAALVAATPPDHSSSSSSNNNDNKKFYIYEWPDLVNRYANHTDRPHHSHGVEIPDWRSNHGAGRHVSKNTSEYKTSQFGLFKIMYQRALIDPRRTLDPALATTFFIPYDFGMDAAFFESNGRMRRYVLVAM
jgi:hypothetical protein